MTTATATTHPTYHLTCLCAAIHEPVACSKAAQVPFPTSLCHCNPCRYASGALYSALPRLTGPPSAPTLARCTHYASLGPTGLQRYFCSTCGTHVCLLDKQDGEWHGGAGAIEPDGRTRAPNVVRVTGHIFANDPRDGGVMGARPGLVRLRYGDIESQPCFSDWKEGPVVPYAPLQEQYEATTRMAEPDAAEHLTVKCHCGGTDLRIRRANYTEDEQRQQQAVAEHERHIPPGGKKYLANFCACRSCRLANGLVSLQPWAAVPPANITVAATGETVVFGARTKEPEANKGTSLKYYWSSEQVCWSFCGTCGSLVFYWNGNSPEVVEVAVGNMRAEEGSMATRWLSWEWNRVSFAEEVVDKEIYKAIVGE